MADSGGGMFSFNLDDNKNRQRITSDEIEAAQAEEVRDPHSPPSTGPEAQTRVDINTERTLDQRFASLLDTRATTANISHDPGARRAYGSLTGTRIVAGPHLRYPPNQPSNHPPNPAGPPNPTNPEEWVWQTPDVREFMQLLEDKRRGEETTQRNIEGERSVPIMINPPTNDIPYLRNLYLRCAANVWNRFPHPWLKADGRAPAMYDMHGTDPVPMHPNLHHPDKRPNIPWESLSRSQQIDENDYQRVLSHWHNLQSVNSDDLTICGWQQAVRNTTSSNTTLVYHLGGESDLAETTAGPRHRTATVLHIAATHQLGQTRTSTRRSRIIVNGITYKNEDDGVDCNHIDNYVTDKHILIVGLCNGQRRVRRSCGTDPDVYDTKL
eukprot:g24300.t1